MSLITHHHAYHKILGMKFLLLKKLGKTCKTPHLSIWYLNTPHNYLLILFCHTPFCILLHHTTVPVLSPLSFAHGDGRLNGGSWYLPHIWLSVIYFTTRLQKSISILSPNQTLLLKHHIRSILTLWCFGRIPFLLPCRIT